MLTRTVSVFARDIFAGKTACVTGGGSGIGFAIAAELNYLGCNVVIAGRNNEKLLEAAKRLTVKQSLVPSTNNKNTEIAPIQCNVRNEEQVVNLVKKTVSRFGRLDFLVNNAGGQFLSPLLDTTTKGWNAVIETNLTGTFLCCREAVNQWMKDHGGAIVNITVNNMCGTPLMGHSGAARAGVENLSKTAAIEWAQYGIRINCVEPGFVYSETAAANYKPGLFEAAAPLLPPRRSATVEEVSSAVCFLLSPGASYITGSTIRVDGGSVLTNLFYSVPKHKNRWPTFGSSKCAKVKEDEN